MSSQNFEQQVTFYHNIFVYYALAALIFLIIAIALFFLLKIPRVFGEMTGRNAKKAIDEMMEENAKSGSLTSAKLSEDGRRRRRGRTDVLDNSGSAQTDVLHVSGLGSTTENPGTLGRQGDDVFVVLRSIVEIHTDEVI